MKILFENVFFKQVLARQKLTFVFISLFLTSKLHEDVRCHSSQVTTTTTSHVTISRHPYSLQLVRGCLRCCLSFSSLTSWSPFSLFFMSLSCCSSYLFQNSWPEWDTAYDKLLYVWTSSFFFYRLCFSGNMCSPCV